MALLDCAVLTAFCILHSAVHVCGAQLEMDNWHHEATLWSSGRTKSKVGGQGRSPAAQKEDDISPPSSQGGRRLPALARTVSSVWTHRTVLRTPKARTGGHYGGNSRVASSGGVAAGRVQPTRLNTTAEAARMATQQVAADGDDEQQPSTLRRLSLSVLPAIFRHGSPGRQSSKAEQGDLARAPQGGGASLLRGSGAADGRTPPLDRVASAPAGGNSGSAWSAATGEQGGHGDTPSQAVVSMPHVLESAEAAEAVAANAHDSPVVSTTNQSFGLMDGGEAASPSAFSSGGLVDDEQGVPMV